MLQPSYKDQAKKDYSRHNATAIEAATQVMAIGCDEDVWCVFYNLRMALQDNDALYCGPSGLGRMPIHMRKALYAMQPLKALDPGMDKPYIRKCKLHLGACLDVIEQALRMEIDRHVRSVGVDVLKRKQTLYKALMRDINLQL